MGTTPETARAEHIHVPRSVRFSCAISTTIAFVLLAGCATAVDGAHEIGRGDRLTGRALATRSPVIATLGMAATAHPIASQVAIDVLKRGGSAVDAAIAANAALGLMEPVACGIGGDLFAIVWDPKSAKLYGINGSGRSPKGRTLEELKARLAAIGSERIPKHGSLSVTVPGTVDAWFELHAKLGRLPMSDVLSGPIAYAEEGVPVPQLIAHYWARNFEGFAKSKEAGLLEELDNAKRTYLIDGRPPREGEVFKNPDLARTYRALAEGGRDAFYRGPLAQVMAAYFERIGGDLGLEDFAQHESEWVDPISVSYRGHDVYELPPNTQGIAALMMLKILEGFDLSSMAPADRLHVMIEAKRLVFEDRAKYFADPAFAKLPLGPLLSEDYAAKRRASIDMSRARAEVGPGAFELEGGDTTYLTVADRDGMMVSLIQSNYRGMGSGLVPDGLGFMLQDRGELFSLDPAHANAYAPGKRPFHTIIPAFVMKDGKPWLSFGVMGGDMQPQGHVQVLVNLIDLGMGIQEAGDAARWRHVGSTEPTGELLESAVQVESGIPERVRASLVERGHAVVLEPSAVGGYQAIMRSGGVYYGASEMRKDGAAIGY
jgi:gamma-glutamyltranspeptidase/glutathione hydrolase